MRNKAVVSVGVGERPDLLKLAEEVRQSGEPRMLTRGDQQLAVLRPLPKPKAKPARRRRKSMTVVEMVGDIIGIADGAMSPDAPTAWPATSTNILPTLT